MSSGSAIPVIEMPCFVPQVSTITAQRVIRVCIRICLNGEQAVLRRVPILFVTLLHRLANVVSPQSLRRFKRDFWLPAPGRQCLLILHYLEFSCRIPADS